MRWKVKQQLQQIFEADRRELPVVVLLFLFFFLVIAVFQILKPLKNGLFVENYGADVELYAKLANILVAAAGVAVFSFLYNRLPRQQLIYSLCGFFIVALLLLAQGLQDPGPWSIWSFYLLGDLESTLMVAAFWAYTTDISTTGQAKRLFGAIGAGGVTGGWVGISLARFLLNRLGMEGLLLLSVGFFVAILVLTYQVERYVRKSRVFRLPQPRSQVASSQKEASSQFSTALEGMQLVLRSPYLAAIVGILGFYEIASQVMDYQFKLLTEQLSGVTETQAFMSQVYFYTNCLSVFVQLFLVSLFMRKFGLVTTLLVMPVAIFLSSLAFMFVPTLLVASFLVISDNGLNYSIQQTGRETLYVITSPDEKYKARAFTNMFVQRLAKGAGIFAVMGLGLVGVGVQYLSLITMTVVFLMILCSLYAGRRFQELSPADAEELKAA